MDAKVIEFIVQGGAVGIALVLILLINKIVTQCQKTSDRVTEVIEHNAQALQKLTDSIDVNTVATEKIGEALETSATRKKRI